MLNLLSPVEILKRHYGHQQFRGPQQEIIERTLEKKHSLVIMPTGMGKSLCFQIPAVLLPRANSTNSAERTLTLVISPLIALMKDQVDALTTKGIAATYVNSSLDRNERLNRYRGIAEGQWDLLYVTPERFRKPDFTEVLAKRSIELLAVDEAHCISQWGHDFRPDYTRMREIRSQLGNPTTIALTATATPDVQKDIVVQLGLAADQVKLFHQGIDRPNLSLRVEEVWDDDNKTELIVQQRKRADGSGIVYFTLIRKLMEFSERLWNRKIPHLIYHGDLDRLQRRRLQESFMAEDGHLVLATNAFGMGIDKEDIRYVLHADLPNSLESYYQEMGRAGRDGLASECLLMYDQRDLATQLEFIQWSNPNANFYQRVYDLLQSENEKINAFGLEWLRERLHHKQKHDRRLETTLGMLDRWEVTVGSVNAKNIKVVSDLPDHLSDSAALDEKLDRDRQKLLSMMQYAKHEGDRRLFLAKYFGLEGK